MLGGTLQLSDIDEVWGAPGRNDARLEAQLSDAPPRLLEKGLSGGPALFSVG